MILGVIVLMYHQILKPHSNTVHNNNGEIFPWLQRISVQPNVVLKITAVLESVQRMALIM